MSLKANVVSLGLRGSKVVWCPPPMANNAIALDASLAQRQSAPFESYSIIGAPLISRQLLRCLSFVGALMFYCNTRKQAERRV
jgi:hypothetical protein